MKKKIVIGISGGIASGKSLVSEYIKNKGYKIYDCDFIAHDIFELQETKEEIANTFNIDDEGTQKLKVFALISERVSSAHWFLSVCFI